MWNIYDQSNRVTYPNYTSGYWQSLPDESSRDVYERFTQAFGEQLDTINAWGANDRMAGVLQRGKVLYLMRVHNGGRDSNGRPQRWTLYLWREENVPARRALDFTRWLDDPKWPASLAPVPLPAPVPTAPYAVPLAAATPVDDSELPQGGRLSTQLHSILEAGELWAAWASAPEPRRAKDGFLCFTAIGGTFKCLHELDLHESETYLAEVAAEKRRLEEEEHRRREEEERLRREREELERQEREAAAEKRRLEEEALRLKKEEVRRQRAERLRRIWNSKPVSRVVNLFLLFLKARDLSGPTIGQPWAVSLPDNVKLELVPIAAGSFTMGSPKSENYRYSDETQHGVTISKPYWLGKYPVTQGQWEAVMGNNPSHFKNVGKDAPVEMVSWEGAKAFCAKLTERERVAGRLPAGYRYTLPTEAEWEYACRAGTKGPFNTGDNLTTSQANYNENNPFNVLAKGEYRKTTTKVGSFPPNAWGLYDMHGNVREWCSDWYGDYPTGSVTDPVGPKTGVVRVLRGGGWGHSALVCRSASRGGVGPGYRGEKLGFRLALSSVGK